MNNYVEKIYSDCIEKALFTNVERTYMCDCRFENLVKTDTIEVYSKFDEKIAIYLDCEIESAKELTERFFRLDVLPNLLVYFPFKNKLGRVEYKQPNIISDIEITSVSRVIKEIDERAEELIKSKKFEYRDFQYELDNKRKSFVTLRENSKNQLDEALKKNDELLKEVSSQKRLRDDSNKEKKNIEKDKKWLYDELKNEMLNFKNSLSKKELDKLRKSIPDTEELFKIFDNQDSDELYGKERRNFFKRKNEEEQICGNGLSYIFKEGNLILKLRWSIYEINPSDMFSWEEYSALFFELKDNKWVPIVDDTTPVRPHNVRYGDKQELCLLPVLEEL